MRDTDEEGEVAPTINVSEAPQWPWIPGVPNSHRRRWACLLTAIELAPNVGGRDSAQVIREAIHVADLIQDFILTNAKPFKPSVVETTK